MKPLYYIYISILLSSISQVLMKYGVNKINANDFKKNIFNVHIISGLGLYGLAAVLWIFALSKVQLSYAYPMVALGYIIVFILSYFIFNDTISILKISGLSLILIGVIIMSKS